MAAEEDEVAATAVDVSAATEVSAAAEEDCETAVSEATAVSAAEGVSTAGTLGVSATGGSSGTALSVGAAAGGVGKTVTAETEPEPEPGWFKARWCRLRRTWLLASEPAARAASRATEILAVKCMMMMMLMWTIEDATINA